jgi:hypothetical protein
LNKLDIQIRPGISAAQIQHMLDIWAKQNDAMTKPMGRLMRRYKTAGENLHWHVTGRMKGMGTVEITYLPSNGILTVLVHDNRRGQWARDAYKALARELEKSEL